MVKKLHREIFHEMYARLKNPRGTTRVNADKLYNWLLKNGYIEGNTLSTES